VPPWALLFSSGAITPRFWKARWPTTWLKVHKILNLSAVALARRCLQHHGDSAKRFLFSSSN